MSMYFLSRADGGRQLAERLADLRYENSVVLAISPGSVVVAAEIAAKLHSLITLMMSERIILPDGKTTIGIVNDEGNFSFSNNLSKGESSELAREYRGSIEQSKLSAIRDLHSIEGTEGLLKKEFFRGRHVVVVSDGARDGTMFDAADKYLHGISTLSHIYASPVASVKTIDRLHVIADRIEVIRVVPEYFDTEHYYEDNQIPEEQDIYNYLNNIILHWEGLNHKDVTTNNSSK